MVGQFLLDAPEATLELPDGLELRVDGLPLVAEFRRFGGREVVVELFDEADDRVGAFPVQGVELLARELCRTTSEVGRGRAR